ncbi:Iron-regulated protein A [Pseudoalteromonas holothuriae]|uniref:Iron-regulated protein A n=1 Tax=Pseudoalteromonas holothuriae TaxID=2963714 RepID=A0A9W4QSC0_9GAMM|nr:MULTISPECIES: imelysin family protein [unclassified Pseudoalteromonas]CAH9051069.1 Iron-regulated protein A [Pseudoalteromonas sp. CIP111854]CAH9060134.1 Iron-regulated protein A [Pseudoalteromonas sp. CIP111951]
MAPTFKPLLLASTLAALLSGCGESTSSSTGENFSDSKDNGTISFDQQALLVSLTDNVITPTFEAFANKAQSLPAQVKAYCDLETSFDPSMQDEAQKAARDEAKLAAQDAWRETMVSWQHAELMVVGPLLENDKSLRNDIYSWPNASTCSVDQDVVFFEQGMINGVAYNIRNRSDKRRGLDASEYLLFNDELAYSCSSVAAGDILANWNTRDEQSRKVARCQFAVEVANDLSHSAQTLLNQWSGEQGYSEVLKTAGQPGNKFETQTKAINEISDALFYMTEELKDYKLATPLGLFANSCGLEACPQAVESVYAKHSIENIKANITAFEQLFLGGNGDAAATGFDDFLDEQQASDTKQVMLQGIADAKVAVNALEGNLQTTLVNDQAAVTNTHEKVKVVTDQLKNDFINKLALELPKTSAGDND